MPERLSALFATLRAFLVMLARGYAARYAGFVSHDGALASVGIRHLLLHFVARGNVVVFGVGPFLLLVRGTHDLRRHLLLVVV